MKKAIILVCIGIISTSAFSQGNRGNNQQRNETGIFYNTTPEHLYDIILSRPTGSSITISVMSDEELEGYFIYGKNLSSLSNKTKAYRFEKRKPLHPVN